MTRGVRSWRCSLICGLLVGCGATQPSQQLLDARTAYTRASHAPASRYALDSLYEAKKSLDAAESAHAEALSSYVEVSLAYVATRRAELAMVRGSLAHAIKVKRESERALLERQAELIDATRRDAQAVNNQLTAQAQQLRQTQLALEQERAAKREAQGRALLASDNLKHVASVTSDAARTTIILDGSVMFTPGQSHLLPSANATLDRVAVSVADISSGATLRVIGHTDSHGSAEQNRALSRIRAQNVANYLVAKGMDAAKVQAIGKGEDEPVASNETPKGRASNRRVELVVEQAEQLTTRVQGATDPTLSGDGNPIPLGPDTAAPTAAGEASGHVPTQSGLVGPSRGTVH